MKPQLKIVPYSLSGLGCPPARLGRLGDTAGAASPYLPRYSYGVTNQGIANVTTQIANNPASVQVQTVSSNGGVVTTPGAPTNLAQAMAAGMTIHPSLKGLRDYRRKLGSLGVSQDVIAASKGASTGAAIAGAAGAAISTAVAAGIIGQTALPIPGVGFVIGAVIGEAMQLLKAREGKAALSWDALVASWPGAKAQQPQVSPNEGRGLQEVSFAESLKGMMDEGGKAFSGCGANAHKNPDCLMQPMGQAIINGYATGVVPLDATTPEVMQAVVIPWLAAGGSGGVTWSVLKAQPTQLTMIQAAVDRYLAGLPITRADMVEPQYKNDPGYNAFHLLSLVDGLIAKGVLQPAPPVTTSAPPAPTPPANAQPITAVNPGNPPPTSQPAIIPNPLNNSNPVASQPINVQPLPAPIYNFPPQSGPAQFPQPVAVAPIASGGGLSMSTILILVGGGLLAYAALG